MKKSSFPLMLTFVLLALLTTVCLVANSSVAYAQASSLQVSVDHTVTVMDGGQVRIADAVKLTADQAASVSNFQVGFPEKYRVNVDQARAYESSNTGNKLAIDLDVGLGTLGFYAVRVNFGRDVNLQTGSSYTFTVEYIFSGLITEAFDNVTQAVVFVLDFPVYPSLGQIASSCTSTVLIPTNANFTGSSYPFTRTSSGSLNLVKEPLEAFSSAPGTASFKSVGEFHLFEVTEAKREVSINEWNTLLVTDSYSIMNKANEVLKNLEVSAHIGAEGLTVIDEFGNTPVFSSVVINNENIVSMTLGTAVRANETTLIKVSYGLPWKDHVSQNGLSSFNLNFKMFNPLNFTVRKLIVTIILPEGAVFQSSNSSTPTNVGRTGTNQERISTVQNDVTSFQDVIFSIAYSRIMFWVSYRPTMWVGTAVLVVGAIAFLWQAQRGGGPTAITTELLISPEDLRNYVKVYDEARKLQRERQYLEEQARKGKIPRRVYRVRSRTLENRLSVLSRDLANLRTKIRGTASKYAEMMQQIEVAENELKGAEADIRRAEVNYRRGELSAAAYHQSLEGAYRRRDRAQTNIDGILLRMREEIG